VRVALVGLYPLRPESVAGGVEASVATLVSALAELPGLELHVVTFVPGLGDPIHEARGEVPVRYLPAPRRFRSLTLHLRERRLLADALAAIRPDVVHAQDALQYGYMCLKTAGATPVVVSIHGIARAYVGLAPSLSARMRQAVALTAFERYCIRHARYLTQPTRYPEEYFHGEIRGRIWDVGNPIPDVFFSVIRDPEPGRVLYAGSILPGKRVLDLIDALPLVQAAVPDAHVCIAGGDVRSEYGRRVWSRVCELGLQDHVALVGARSPQEMIEEYRRASVFVLPSAQETSPMVIGEAMAVGVAVVATRVGGVPYLVEEGRTGHLVEVGDVPAVARAIVELLGDSERAAAYGAAGHVRADRDFRVDTVARRVRAVYEEAVRGHLADPTDRRA
jgi:glycosyltransferase involved in cell wall biosynthesis